VRIVQVLAAVIAMTIGWIATQHIRQERLKQDRCITRTITSNPNFPSFGTKAERDAYLKSVCGRS
jgi:hypothetical protein